MINKKDTGVSSLKEMDPVNLSPKDNRAKVKEGKPTIVKPGKNPCTGTMCMFVIGSNFCAACGLHLTERDKLSDPDLSLDERVEIMTDWENRRKGFSGGF